jgi:hypothetical protein
LAAMNTMATALVDRYRCCDDTQDLIQAEELCRSVIKGSTDPESDSNFIQATANLALILTLAFEENGRVSNLEEAFNLSQSVLRSKSSQEDRVKVLTNLAGIAVKLFEQTGRPELLVEAETCLLEVHPIVVSGNVDSADALKTISTLSLVYKYLFELQGKKKEYLEKAVCLAEQATTLLPSAVSLRATTLNNHAVVSTVRFETGGFSEHLEQAIAGYEEGVLARPRGHPHRVISLGNLAFALTTRFRATGSIQDLETAIQLDYESLALAPRSHPNRPWILLNTIALLVYRHNLYRDPRDVDEAFRLSTEMDELCTEGHILRIPCFSNLASVLQTKYEHSGNPKELEQGTSYLEKALRICGTDNIHRPILLQNLGHQLRCLFQKTLNDADLDNSISHLEDAIRCYGARDTRRPSALRMLAQSCCLKCWRTKDAYWSTYARDRAIEALSFLEIGHPARSECMIQIVKIQTVFRPPGMSLECGSELLTLAILDDACSPQIRLRELNSMFREYHPPTVFSILTTEAAIRGLVEKFACTIRLLPRVAYLGLDSRARLDALTGTEYLANDAAGYALAASDCEQAVELLEQGRAIFWSQALKLRTPLEDLPKDLRDEIRKLCEWLEADSLTWNGTGETEESVAAVAQRASLRRQQSERLNALLNRVRQEIPGLHRFMLHEEFRTLAEAAKFGPIVILLASKVKCSAIIIERSGQATRVALPAEITTDRLIQLRKNWLKGLSDPKTFGDLQFNVLSELWRKVVKIVIDAMGLKVSIRFRLQIVSDVLRSGQKERTVLGFGGAQLQNSPRCLFMPQAFTYPFMPQASR